MSHHLSRYGRPTCDYQHCREEAAFIRTFYGGTLPAPALNFQYCADHKNGDRIFWVQGMVFELVDISDRPNIHIDPELIRRLWRVRPG